MTDKKTTGITECLPKQGFIYDEDTPTSIVCKPKLMPLKSVTLEKVIIFKLTPLNYQRYFKVAFVQKLEKLQLEAEQKLRNQNDGFNNQNTLPSYPFQ